LNELSQVEQNGGEVKLGCVQRTDKPFLQMESQSIGYQCVTQWVEAFNLGHRLKPSHRVLPPESQPFGGR
jgi:hypothetical protein